MKAKKMEKNELKTRLRTGVESKPFLRDRAHQERKLEYRCSDAANLKGKRVTKKQLDKN
jgi:hypothetical protein